MPMSEEDEIFLEKSFQRTLIVCPIVSPLTTVSSSRLNQFLINVLFKAFASDPSTSADKQELEKLISHSATPTAVWRRTGEVCYANPEFCALVKRNENDLLANSAQGKKQYIYQLFAKPS
jgi:hypothetical protein